MKRRSCPQALGRAEAAAAERKWPRKWGDELTGAMGGPVGPGAADGAGAGTWLGRGCAGTGAHMGSPLLWTQGADGLLGRCRGRHRAREHPSSAPIPARASLEKRPGAQVGKTQIQSLATSTKSAGS